MGLNRYIAKQFGNPSGLGGKLVSAVMNKQNRPMYEQTERLLSPAPADHVLDIGCGNGYALQLLAQSHACVFDGIDISQSALTAAARRNRQAVQAGRMHFFRQNVESMSFASASFDKAYTINTVYFWSSLDAALAETRRVLKPGGLFVNTVYSNETLNRFSHTQFGYKRYTAEQIETASANAGFAVAATPILHGAAYCLVCVAR